MNMVDEIYKAGVESIPVDYTVYPGSFEDVLLRAAAVMAVRAVAVVAGDAEPRTTQGLTRDDIKPERLRSVAVDAQACTGSVDTKTNDAVFGFILPAGPLAIRLDLAGVKFVRDLLNRLPIARDEPEDPEAGALVEEGLREKVAQLEWALEASRAEVGRLRKARDLANGAQTWPQLRDALARAEIEAARLRAEVGPLVDAAADAMATRDEHLERIGKAVQGLTEYRIHGSHGDAVRALVGALAVLREPGAQWLEEMAAASEERRSHLAALKMLGWKGEPPEEWASRVRDAAENMVVQADAVRHALGITRADDIITAAQTAARALRETK